MDKLSVRIFDDRQLMGAAAAEMVLERIKTLLERKERVNIIFAAAPSQNEFLHFLIADTSTDWSRVNAFHMDEYIGLDSKAPQLFGNFLRRGLFDHLPFGGVFYINGSAGAGSLECQRYADLLKQFPADIVCLGIGENAHLAFNDPPVADFNDEHIVKIVELDEACRMQQVNDGCFASISEVPSHAITLTIPVLLKADYLFCVVPGKTKSRAVRATLKEKISENYPSTILRRHSNCVLFLDKESAALVEQ